MRKTALALAVFVAASTSAFAITEADLSPAEHAMLKDLEYTNPKLAPETLKEADLSNSEKALLASLRAKGTVDVAAFLRTRFYIIKSMAACCSVIAANSFDGKPKGFLYSYLLPGEAQIISDAVTANVAAMAKSLWA